MTKAMDGPWYYQQVALGYNYRMTDLQGALGASQMTRLDHYVARRHEIARRYDELLKDLPITTPWLHPDGYSGLHLYVIRLQLNKITKTHLQVFEALRAKEILVNLHYMPVHTHPFYQQMGFKLGQFPEAERYYAEAISIPMYPSMTESQQEQVVNCLRDAIGL
jgi:dTDP-4-amino-4,6-dideoxygalactose transaminase